MKKITLIIIPLLFSYSSFAQIQIGQDINGEAVDDFSGWSVSLSSDGSTIAIGARFNDGNGAHTGHVRVYKNVNDTWRQVGSDIDGESEGDQSGISVTLSSDGSIVAIGAVNNDGNNVITRSGHVRVYKNVNDTWRQVGSDIDGEGVGDFSGQSVSLSSDGSIVAIGAALNDGNGTSSGHARVYENVNDTWRQVGADIDGEAANDGNGISVSLSSDGSTVAIGAVNNDGNGTNSGHVRVYENVNDTWRQVGSDIDGEAASDQSGYSVSLSSDGSTVAIGTHRNDGNGTNSGHVRVYENVNDTWRQVGSDIDGESEGDQSGHSVSLSSDGNTLAIGANFNDGNGTKSGHARVYENTNDTWRQVGIDIDGEAAGDESGYSVSLSSDGNTVAIGAPRNNTNKSGHVRIYNIEKCALLSITTDPKDVTITIGENAIMRVESSYDSFQWQTDTGTGYKDIANTGQFDGAKTDSLSITQTTLSNNEQKFRCIVSKDGCTDTTKVATLTVECEIQPITSNPVDVKMPIRGTAIMGLKSSYDSFQWQTDTGTGYKNITNTGQFDGVNKDTLTIMQIKQSNNKQPFRCIVSTKGCADTSEVAILTVESNVGINDIKTEFIIYPNPSTNELKIKIESNLLGSAYGIYNSLGQKVGEGRLTNKISIIDVSNLPKGNYVLKMVKENLSYKIQVH